MLDDDVLRLAKGANLATVVTLMPSGQPQAQLRWIDTDGDKLLVNTEPERRAAKNVVRDPRITVLIHAAGNPYDWAEVRGKVVAVETGAEARAHLDTLAHKYTGADYQMPVGPAGRMILKVEPQRVVTPATVSRQRSTD